MPDRLDTYRAKRHPGRTPEPFGPPDAGAKRAGRKLSFVVQKHAARRLHWDFRLELGGTLRSWAVPKGPSADPADRRLAVEVEDHPLEYAGFEGIIPSGNYGAGAVIVWDRGTWTPEGDAERGLRDGKLVFRLDGEKLRGEWTLVRTRRGEGGKADWLLMKHRGDAFAGPGRPFGEISVLSGRTLEEVAQGVAAPARRARARRREPRATARPPVEVTDPGKVLFPAEGITKGELVAYHRTIAPLMLPYLADRPVVVTRFPEGIAGRSFAQRDAPEWSPAWMRTAAAPADERGRDLRHFLVDDADGLAWLVNLGVIPIHVMASRAGSPDRPDWCVVGLEPGGGPFSDVIRPARALHALCEAIGLAAYPKTTGLGGLHVLVPLGGQLSHEQARTLGELLVRAVEARHPGLSTAGRAGSPRGVRLDPLQNGQGKAITAPYTVVGRAGAPVSTPLRWSEVTTRLDPSRFTVRNVPRRAGRLGDDPLRPVLTGKPDLPAALERLREELAGPGRRGRRAARTSAGTRG